jgi:hypothetical protein
MVSNLAKQLMGETMGTTTGDIAPVMTGASVISNPPATAAKRKIPTMKPDKLKKMRNRVVDGLMGIKEDRDGAVIPNDAKEVQTIEQNDHGLNLDTPKIPGQKIRNPYSGEEPLILPAASLVAPDVTPKGIFPLDPSQLPGADQGKAPVETPLAPPGAAGAASPTVDVLLGKTPGPANAGIQAQPTAAASTADRMSTESALSRLPGIPSPSASVAPTGTALLNAPLPDPAAASGSGDIKNIMEAFRLFVPPKPLRFE